MQLLRCVYVLYFDQIGTNLKWDGGVGGSRVCPPGGGVEIALPKLSTTSHTVEDSLKACNSLCPVPWTVSWTDHDPELM